MPSLEARMVMWWMRWARLRRQRAALRGSAAAPEPARPSAGLLRRLRIRESIVDDQLLYRITATASAAAPAGRIIYLHGGAYVRPINRHHWRFIADLARRSGCEIVVPLYPLAPRHSGLSAFRCVASVYRREADGTLPLILMGDSAGAGLAVALAGWLRDHGLPPPRRLLLLSPWLDVTVPHPQALALQPADPMLSLDGLRRAGRAYAGVLGTDHPLISPAHGDLRGLPPMSMYVGGRELLGPDALAYAERLQAAGGSVDVHHAPAMMHVWPLLDFPEARAARARIAAQVRATLGGTAHDAEPPTLGRPAAA